MTEGESESDDGAAFDNIRVKVTCDRDVPEGIPWTLRVFRDRTGANEHIFLSPMVDAALSFWRVDFDAECVINKGGSSDDEILQKWHTFDHDSPAQDHISFSWESVDEEKKDLGLNKDDRISVVISVKISIEGINLSSKPVIVVHSYLSQHSKVASQSANNVPRGSQMIRAPGSDHSALFNTGLPPPSSIGRNVPSTTMRQPSHVEGCRIPTTDVPPKEINPTVVKILKRNEIATESKEANEPRSEQESSSLSTRSTVTSQSTVRRSDFHSTMKRPSASQRCNKIVSSSSRGDQSVSFFRPSNLTKLLSKVAVPSVDDPVGVLVRESDPRSYEALLPTLGSCALGRWCSRDDRDAAVVADSNFVRWQPDLEENCAPELKSLPIFVHHGRILEEMQKYDVVVVIAQAATGKSQIGPALLSDLLRADVNGRRSISSRRGLTLCPSSDHAENTVKMAEKLYMTKPHAYCEIANFVDHFAKGDVMLKPDPSKDVLNSAKHAITTYRGGLRSLEKGPLAVRLRLLHIDEAHSAKAELRDLLALARHRMVKKSVEKLVLTSATLEEEEIVQFKRYFNEHGLSLGVVRLSQDESTHDATTNRRTMSCVGLDDKQATILSSRITQDIKEGKAHKPSEHEEKTIWPFGSEENQPVPEMNNMLPWFKTAVDRAMERATEFMKWRGDKQMPSILILIPGQEHADRIKSTIENTYLDSEGGPKYPYKYFTFEDSGKPAFVIERLRSVRKQKVAGGMRAEAEFEDSIHMEELTEKSRNQGVNPFNQGEEWKQKMAELRNPEGPGFEKGKIILATPDMADGLTLVDVAVVVDAGVSKISGPYLRNGLGWLNLIWIDNRQLEQRAGRCGRTCEGEYFVCASWSKVQSIRRSDIREKLFVANYDEISWMRALQLGVMGELIWTPPAHLTNEFEKSFTIKGLWKGSGFTSEADELYRSFPFLTPDIARFVIMGVRLGLAAHTISYVAEHMSTHKLCARPTKIRENYNAISDSQAYDTFVNILAQLTSMDDEEDIRPYCIGDSVCQADLNVTWLRHTFPPFVKPSPTEAKKPAQRAQSQSDHSSPESSKEPAPLPDLDIELEPNYDLFDTYDDVKWKQLEELAEKSPDGLYWAGNWCTGKEEKRDEVLGMKKLQQVFIRSEGRESFCMNVTQLTKACQRLGIITPAARLGEKERGSIFSPRFNRYLRGPNNYNLSPEGRALFRALLTMCSDKMASVYRKEWWIDDVKNYDHVFEIHATTEGGVDTFMDFFPKRMDWKAREIVRNAAKAKPASLNALKGRDGRRGPDKSVETKATSEFVRYWNAFKATHSYNFTGCADPISVKQAAFFINTFGDWKLEGDVISISLNASPKDMRNGIAVGMLGEEVARRVETARSSLLKAARRIVCEHSSVVGAFDAIGEAILSLWMALDDGTEASIQIQEEWKEKAKDLALCNPQKRPLWFYNGERVPQEE